MAKKHEPVAEVEVPNDSDSALATGLADAVATATAAPVVVEETVAEETVVESTAVAIIPEGSHAVATLADVGALMEEDAAHVDHGFEKQDIAIPFMRVLQSNSPQATPKQPTYVDGAESGMFFNTATSEVYDGEGLEVIPISFIRQATLWWPRLTGGPNGAKGFVREVPIPEAQELLKKCTKNDKGKDVTPDGQELVFAAMYYIMVLREKSATPQYDLVAFPLTSTQLKKARMWNALIMGARLPNGSGVGTFNPKMFGFTYRISTVPESNAKGTWMGVKIERGQPLLVFKDGNPAEGFPGGAQLYLAARDLEKLVSTGKVKVKQEELRGDDDGGSMAGGADAEKDETLPF